MQNLHPDDERTEDPYVSWLKAQQVPLLQGGGTVWRRYFHYGALVPASTKPEALTLESDRAQELLRDSGTHLVRYFSRTIEEPTQFWYVVCEQYDFEALPGKMKTKIRRAYKDCAMRRLEPAWLAEHGYECYAAAFDRYKNAVPDSRELFRKKCLSCASGPFEFLGAFIGDTLAGFAKMIVGHDYVTMTAFKVHPGFPTSRPAYALMDFVLREYVAGAKKPTNNGFRSLNHDTNMQDFVLQFGFRKVYCDMRIIYRPPLGLLVNIAYPLKPLIDRLPAAPVISSIKTLLRQEEIHRSFPSQVVPAQL